MAAAPSRTRPNVVLIVADDLGYGDLSCYGNTILSTPNVDRLAAEGVRCSQHYSGAPICAPARAALLTGRYHHRCGALSVESNRGLDRIALRERTIGDVFAAAGYRTGYVGKWHNGVHDRRYHPNRRGFAEFAGFLSGIMDYWDWFLDYNGSSRRADGRYQTDVFTAEAVDFIRRGAAAPGSAARQPFLLVVAYHAPHAPLQAPEESCAPFRQRGDLNPALATMYGMVAHMDRGIGQILDTLEATGCAGDTVVLVTSDNGPHLGPERYGGRRFSMERFNGPFRGQKQDVLEGGIRVPAIVRWPDGLPAGAACDEMIHFCDWLPTLAAAAGVTAGRPAAGRLRSVAGVARHHPRRRRAALLAVQPLRSGARLQPGAARRPLEAVLAAHPGSDGQAAGGQRGGARADGAPALRDGGAQSAGGAHAFGTGRAGVVPHPRRPLRGPQPGRRTSRPRRPHAAGGRELVRRGGGGAPGERRTVVTGGVIVG